MQRIICNQYSLQTHIEQHGHDLVIERAASEFDTNEIIPITDFCMQ